MLEFFDNLPFSKRFAALMSVDMMGVSSKQLKLELNRAQMRVLPFLSGSVGLLFVFYAFFQAVFLHETLAPILILVGLLSALVLFGLQYITQRLTLPEHWAERLFGLVTSLALISILLRLYVTRQPRQIANLILFLVAVGALFFAKRWLIGMIAATLGGWLFSVFTIAEFRDNGSFYMILMLAAGATAVILHITRLNMYRRIVILRIRERELRREIKQFNQQLERKVQERTQALQNANAKLERLDRTKTDFITIASHELRTPLTILNFYAQMFQEDDAIQQDPQYLKWAKGIHQGATRMEEVVERMLDVAKIDTAALDLHPGPVRLPFFLSSVLSTFKEALAERQLSTVMGDFSALPEIEADTESLQKVFNHLIVNAIKYTPDGGTININGRSFTQLAPNNPTPAVEITIQDTGIGIPQEAQQLIFEKFYQTGEVKLHSSGKTSFKGGGAGLGLAIAQGIVAAHNGRIWVTSPGYSEKTCPGSTFHVVLPVSQAVG